MDASLWETLFAYKAWADEELLDTIARLDAAEHAEAHRTSIRLMHHFHIVDAIFKAQLTGTAHGYAALNTPHTPELHELRSKVLQLDRWYVEQAPRWSAAELGEAIDFSFVDGKPAQMNRAEMLLHVATHSNYHRGAIGELLHSAGMALPKDSITVFLHRAGPRPGVPPRQGAALG